LFYQPKLRTPLSFFQSYQPCVMACLSQIFYTFTRVQWQYLIILHHRRKPRRWKTKTKRDGHDFTDSEKCAPLLSAYKNGLNRVMNK